MNPTVLNYVALMLFNLQQNPRFIILTMLLSALPHSLASRAMTRDNLPTVAV